MTDPGDALSRAEEAELSRRAEAGRGDSVVSPLADSDERVIEGALRPKRLDDFVGQARVREQLTLLLHSAMRRGRPPDHVLLSGPPGLGKTTIAMIIAAELGTPMRITSGPAIERSGDLAASGAVPARAAAPSWRDQVQTGLMNLGWSARDADAAIAAVEAESAQVPDVPTALRAALRKLSRQ